MGRRWLRTFVVEVDVRCGEVHRGHPALLLAALSDFYSRRGELVGGMDYKTRGLTGLLIASDLLMIKEEGRCRTG